MTETAGGDGTATSAARTASVMVDPAEPAKPAVAITYCRQCGWLLRAAWMAQEILSTFAESVGSVTLVPATGGVFRIEIAGELVWDRARDGGFPDVRTLKQLVRDRVEAGRDLGHLDRPKVEPEPP